MTDCTPGPWRAHKTGIVTFYGTRRIQVATARQPIFTVECQEANARLIAAAPELLAALQPLAAMGDASLRKAILAALRPHERDSFIAATDNARAAIAKATGAQS